MVSMMAAMVVVAVVVVIIITIIIIVDDVVVVVVNVNGCRLFSSLSAYLYYFTYVLIIRMYT